MDKTVHIWLWKGGVQQDTYYGLDQPGTKANSSRLIEELQSGPAHGVRVQLTKVFIKIYVCWLGGELSVLKVSSLQEFRNNERFTDILPSGSSLNNPSSS